MYRMDYRIGASKTDTNGALKLPAAVDMLQDCSMFWMESEPAFMGFMRENNLGMFLTTRQLDVVRMPSYGENVHVQTSIYACKGFMGYRNTVMYDEKNTPCILSWSTGSFVSFETGRMTRLPKEVLDIITLDPRVEMEYLDKRVPVPLHLSSLPPVSVRKSDIDLYHHVNNARYLEAALELLPDGYQAKRFRAEYKKPAVFGDFFYPQMGNLPDNSLCVMLGDKVGSPYAIFEFSG